MFWPGMGDPAKRKKTLKFLAITAAIGISVGVTSMLVQQWFNLDNPLMVCINDRRTPYKISATLELYVDGQKAEIPANIGIVDRCTHSLSILCLMMVRYMQNGKKNTHLKLVTFSGPGQPFMKVVFQ